ncbi:MULTISPECIES: DUF1553 domain-containing protein [Arenibacter]|uniref:DUF1553 domain-containing protein n=1 Tax=Arenibacter TaxID=178469 RepID=UPI00068D7C01|nr:MULTISPECIES: DUF1553 domain-containing protein [Arenibacter]GBF20177.1 planctomycete cytochrome C [Arenibacter sp. NBRC 103722]
MRYIYTLQKIKFIATNSLYTLSWVLTILFLGSCNDSSNNEISFNRDVRPILNNKCLRCHGGVKASGEFSLLFEEDAFSETQSGKPAIVRGNHEKSELYRRLVSKDPEIRMPFESPQLSQEEIDILAKWIDQGAKWEKHWAYIPPKENIIPPVVADSGWSNNSIDQFVFSKLNKKGLSPSTRADKNTLLRRLYLDLTGLPPTVEQAKTFLEDNSSDAYKKLVDELLRSPHFGERWASMWLDLARYADSKGFEKDTNREIWKFRDWVITAFNKDMPFDQFSVEQLAGDLLPEPTQEQLIATAFHRNTLANDEGGTDNEEFRVASVVDRVSTTYEVWQGTTMACVQCHSHPYDPFRHEEFYESMAFFNNAVDDDSYFERPKLFTYSHENKKEVEGLLEYINGHLSANDKQTAKPRFLYDQKEALLTHLGYRFVEAEAFDKTSPFIELDGSLNFLWQIQDSSWASYNNVDLRKVNKMGFLASASLDYAGDISIHLDSLNGKKIGEVRISSTESSNREENGLKLKEFIADIPEITSEHDVYLQFHKGDSYVAHLFYLDKIFYYEKEPLMEKYNKEIKQKLGELAQIPTTSTPIIQELQEDKARKTFVFDRGSWLNLGEEVNVGIPNIYDIPETEEPSNRLEFAKWMVSDKNPLSARVLVNRFWEQIFGRGLVESMEEFGSQGKNPSHPELLDWLAVKLMKEYNWQIKLLLRDFVLSATYQQSSIVSAKQLELDPSNNYLSRGSRKRLSAEQIRDEILLVSGLLNKTIGGPSVINSDVEIAGGWNTLPDYVIKGDEAKYRRSLYTFWKRVNPPMNMIVFDSPDRSACVSSRVLTNTPLQALSLLNDKTFFEASQELAKQMFEADNQLKNQIKFGYFKVMNKDIEEDKLLELSKLYNDALLHYENNTGTIEFPEAALHYSGKNKYKLAALTMVANVFLNMDEFIVKV